MLKRKITVGQSSRADVRLANVSVSRLHLELAPASTPGHYIVTDLESTNGTYIVTPDCRENKIKAPLPQRRAREAHAPPIREEEPPREWQKR